MMAKPIQDPTCGQHNQGGAQREAQGHMYLWARKAAVAPDSSFTSPHDPPNPGKTKGVSPHLISVVGTGHQQKQPGKGVLGGVGDLPGFGPWHAEQG